MLLRPRNPCESLCSKLFLNVDHDAQPARKVFVCDSCNKFTTFPNLDCACGKPVTKQPKNLDYEGQKASVGAKDGIFVKENGSLFLVLDDLKIVPSTVVTSMQQLMQMGYSDLTQLEERTQNIGNQEILRLLKYSITSHEGGLISKSKGKVYNPRTLTVLGPRSPKRLKEGVVGFVKRPALYGVRDDLRVKPLSSNSCLSYVKELGLPLDDLEVKVISFGEAEALSLLGASLTSKSTLTSGLESFLNVPKQESKLTPKYTHTSRLDDLVKEEPNPEA